MILVSVNPHQGKLRRFECKDGKKVLTHLASIDKPVTFTAKVIEDFRLMPDDCFKVGEPPRPPCPPTMTGVARAA